MTDIKHTPSASIMQCAKGYYRVYQDGKEIKAYCKIGNAIKRANKIEKSAETGYVHSTAATAKAAGEAV